MKKLFVLAALLLTACSHSPVRNNVDINELNAVMAYGTSNDLNKINPEIAKDLLVRLYQLPILGEECFVETHGICRNNYYITVSTFDEYPEINVFKLNMVGEITEIHWIQENEYDYVEIEFSLNKYTKDALANNDDLINVHSKVLVKLNPRNHVEIIR